MRIKDTGSLKTMAKTDLDGIYFGRNAFGFTSYTFKMLNHIEQKCA